MPPAAPAHHGSLLPRTVIVVPCYNEARRLDGGTFQAWARLDPDIGFLFVDDGSTDGTRALLNELCAASERLAVLGLDQNGGKAEAVRRGILHAIDQEGVERVGFWDADLATPVDAIPAFQAVLDQRPDVEIVMGSRIRLLGRNVERNPLRHYFGRVAATAISTLIDLRVYDTQCGAKLFRVLPRTRALFEAPYVTRWIFDVEILVRWLKLASPEERAHPDRYIVELPLPEWKDVAGTKIKRSEFLLAPKEIFRIWWAYRP